MIVVRWLVLVGCALVMGYGVGWSETSFAQEKKPSILFINIDDLNDWNETLGGHPQAITPNIKRLASQGLTFTQTICGSPVCFPSRTAVFTGIHPARSGAISNFNWGRSWRFYVGDAVTLPKHLESLGWKTFGAGKNLHNGNKPEFQSYFGRPREPKPIKGSGYVHGPVGWAVTDSPYEQMPDHQVVSWGMKQLKSTSDPIFLSVGIYKPHVKWILPQSSFDKYPLKSLKEPVAQECDLEDLAPRLQRLAHNEAKFGQGFHDRLKKDGQTKQWVRAYLASVTFADEQLGRLLDAWEASDHSRNGIIVLWSDHGFMLGEKEGWCKFKPWYDAIHSNLIIAGPGIPQGATCDSAVSLLDIYPTLVSKLGISPPKKQKLDGNDLAQLLKSPDSKWDKPIVMSHEEDGIRYDVVLDNQHRLTRLITGETELYDLSKDPHEWLNLARDKRYAETVKRLEKFLTFQTPTVSDGKWIEAEDIPCQTSAEYGRRGNFHYPRKNEDASGGKYLCAELTQGKDSYIDFVVRVKRPGTYQVSTVLGMVNHIGDISVSVSDVTTDALQATSKFPMTMVGADKISFTKTKSFQTRKLGKVTFTKPGNKLLRFKLQTNERMVLRFDKIQFSNVQPNSP